MTVNMLRRYSFLFVLFLGLVKPIYAEDRGTSKEVLVIEGAENAKQGSPTRLVVDTLTRMESLVNQGLKSKKVQDQVKEAVRKMFDYSALSEETLSFIWKSADASQRKNFQLAFRNLIEINYIAKAKSYIGDRHQIRFASETIQKNTAKVSCLVAQKEVDIQIVYMLRKTGSSWKVVDIVLDEASLVNSYRSQFSQYLNGGQHTLAQLIQKIESMSKKMESETRVKS